MVGLQPKVRLECPQAGSSAASLPCTDATKPAVGLNSALGLLLQAAVGQGGWGGVVGAWAQEVQGKLAVSFPQDQAGVPPLASCPLLREVPPGMSQLPQPGPSLQLGRTSRFRAVSTPHPPPPAPKAFLATL